MTALKSVARTQRVNSMCRAILTECRTNVKTKRQSVSAKMKQLPFVGSILGQRRRRWPNIEPALRQCLLGYAAVPISIKHSSLAYSMLGQCRSWWANIESSLILYVNQC